MSHPKDLEKLIELARRDTKKAMVLDLQMQLSINNTPKQNETKVLTMLKRWEESLTTSNKQTKDES